MGGCDLIGAAGAEWYFMTRDGLLRRKGQNHLNSQEVLQAFLKPRVRRIELQRQRGTHFCVLLV